MVRSVALILRAAGKPQDSDVEGETTRVTLLEPQQHTVGKSVCLQKTQTGWLTTAAVHPHSPGGHECETGREPGHGPSQGSGKSPSSPLAASGGSWPPLVFLGSEAASSPFLSLLSQAPLPWGASVLCKQVSLSCLL